MKIIRILPLVAALVLTGCISLKSYVDPTYTKATYSSLARPASPLQMRVVAEFSRNGKRLPKLDDEVSGNVLRVVRASGLIEPVDSAANGELLVSVNNVADVGEAAAKGFGTGLTFGLAGSIVRDNYELTMTLTRGGKTITKSGYKHSIISTVGNKKGPEGLTPTTPMAAFGTVVEQMLLNALVDLQAEEAMKAAALSPEMSWSARVLAWLGMEPA